MKYPKRLFGTPLKLVDENVILTRYVDDNVDDSVRITYNVYMSGACGIEVTYDVKFLIGDETVVRIATLYVYKCSERAARKAIRAAFERRIHEVYNVMSKD
jgi:hypothetical protein